MENIPFTIRKARKEDVDEIYHLGNKINQLKFSFSKKHNFHEKDEMTEWIRKPKDNIFLVSFQNERAVGFLYAKIIDCHWCLLDNIAVLPKYRKHGIGTMLLDSLYEILREQKIDYIQILEEVHHKKTRDFWKKKGFKERHVFIWADKIIDTHKNNK
jgi:N-acetylglutamate synthase-like GNAT family acetyltransferase